MAIFKKTNLIFISTLIIFIFFIFSTVALAQTAREDALKGLDITGNPSGFKAIDSDADPSENIAILVGRISNYIFGPVAIIFFIFILIGGYQWMIAKGNEERLDKAKKFILNSIWGLMVIFFAWTLVIVILSALNKATNLT